MTDIDLSALAAARDGSQPLRVTWRPHRPGVVMIRALPPVLGPSRRPTFSNFVVPTPIQTLWTFR